MPTPAALIGPHDRRVVDVTGADRLTYLDAVLSQRLRDAAPGTATAGLELGPHGEPKGAVELAVLDDRAVLLLPPAAEETLERLAGRTFLSDAVFEPRDDVEVRRLRGDATGVLDTAGLAHDVGTASEVDDVLVLVQHHGVDLVGTADTLDALVDRLVDAGARPADAAALDDMEVVLGVPRLGDEIVHGRLPEEVGVLPTHVHLEKGCYPGQEAVARMWMLGRPRRRLARLAVGSDVEAGATYGEGKRSVQVTRVADLDGRRVALGFVPADAAAGDTPAPDVEVLALVGDDLPVPGHDPAVPRRRDRR